MMFEKLAGLAIFVLFSALIIGCGEDTKTSEKDTPVDMQHEGQEAMTEEEVPMDKMANMDKHEHGGEMEKGAQQVCPVMGGKINKDIYVDYKGKRIYFCCTACVGTFNKDPEKYLEKMKAAGVEPESVPEK